MTNGNPLITSLSQSILTCINNLFKEFQQLEPNFKYQFSFATNYDNDTPDDTFDIVVQIGSIDRIPSHYLEKNNIDSLLFAGTVDVALNILCPVAVSYTNNLPLTTLVNQQITYDYSDTNKSNYLKGANFDELDDLSKDKVQNTSRILEALALFMYQKGMISNDYELTFLTDMPMISGELDYGKYRLTEDLYIRCKFQKINDFYLSSGELVRAEFNFGTEENPQWFEFYNIVDFTFGCSAVDITYPVSSNNNSLTQNQINQLENKLTISAPAIVNTGANKKLIEFFEKGELNKIQNLPLRYSEDSGKSWKKTTVNVSSMEYPRNIDAFGSTVFILHILKPIVKE